MLKNILNLEGTKKLTANEQKEIKGAGAAPGYYLCSPDSTVACKSLKYCKIDANGGYYCSPQ